MTDHDNRAAAMSDERYRYLNDFIRNVNDCLASTDANANHCGVELTTAHWSHCGVELLDEIDRLRAENAALERERDALKAVARAAENALFEINPVSWRTSTKLRAALDALRSEEKAP